MSNWVPAETELFTQLYNQINEHPLIKNKVKGVFDCVQKEPEYPYLIVGETETLEQETSTDMYETVAVTFHVYSQSANSHETRDILKYVEMVAKLGFEMKGYTIKRIKKDNSTVIPDIDQFTKHGVLRMKYEVKHNTLY
ncbi:tail completion protein gp17 [Mammaliicoccus sciuri]|uniref:tail completion protein gp17 n=1 Tax=Mammaliicoccus sciuri TaxID=1296 RepID=UPI001629862B|nr:DUF3168 domain-containing protein [Mammaliicoccus sciuri]